MVSAKCITDLSELTSKVTVRTNDINNANMGVGDLLGELCFRQLCTALKVAVEEANTYNEVPANEDKKQAIEFLELRWVLVISDMYFKTWYANRVAWFWLEGSSITQLKSVGLITTSNDDEEFKNSFVHAGEKERKRLAGVAERLASNAKDKFKKFFWDAPENNKNYSCSPACPCDGDENAAGESIGMSALKTNNNQ